MEYEESRAEDLMVLPEGGTGMGSGGESTASCKLQDCGAVEYSKVQ